MKNTIIDKFLNHFFDAVILSQKWAYKFNIFCENRIKVLTLFGLIIVIGIVSKILGLYFILLFCIFFLIAFLHLWLIRDWYSSAREFGRLVGFLDLLIIGLGITMVQAFLNINNYLFIVSFIIYFIFWVWLSLVAKEEVSLIINEIVSSVTTIFFTAGTYIYAIQYSNYYVPDILRKSLNKQGTINTEIFKNVQLSKAFLNVIMYVMLPYIFKFLLPFLCTSLFSITMIHLKHYWLKKTGKPDYWEILKKSEKD